MDTFGVLIANIFILVCLKHSFGLSIEDDLFKFSRINKNTLFLNYIFCIQLVVQHSLLSIKSTAIISAFNQNFNEPRDDWNQFRIIETLNLMGGDVMRTFHCLQRYYDFFRELNFLTKF